MFESGELRLVLLRLIADEPRHGYDLIRAIEELTGGEYAPSPGVVYPTLTLLQDMGLIEEARGEGARKPFQVTDEGRNISKENAEEVGRSVRAARRRRIPPAPEPAAGDGPRGRQADDGAVEPGRPGRAGRGVCSTRSSTSSTRPRSGSSGSRSRGSEARVHRAAARARAAFDHPLVDADHRRVDPVPVHGLGERQPRLAVRAAQRRVARIGSSASA